LLFIKLRGEWKCRRLYLSQRKRSFLLIGEALGERKRRLVWCLRWRETQVHAGVAEKRDILKEGMKLQTSRGPKAAKEEDITKLSNVAWAIHTTS